MTCNRLLTSALVVPWLLAGPAFGVDGVIEINQAKLMAGSVTPGDTPGFPLTIDESGSYILTSDLETDQAATSLVLIYADDVTLDLNGFTIAGPNRCTITPGGSASCTGTGGEPGLYSSGSRTVLRNGRILGADGWGVGCVDSCILENLAVHHSYGSGINSAGIVRSCTASHNATDGFEVAGIVADLVATQNGGTGIRLSGGTHGVRLSSSYNLGIGLQINEGASVTGCSVVSNGDGTVPEVGVLLDAGLITDCTISFNKKEGILGWSGTGGFARNVLSLNNDGAAQLSGPLVSLGPNLCGAAACP